MPEPTKRRQGRPASENPRHASVRVYLIAEEMHDVDRHAQAAGMTRSDWVRETLRQRLEGSK